MSRITINLTEEVAVDVSYKLEDNEIIIINIEQTEGNLFDLIQSLDYEGDIFTTLSDRVHDELIIEFGEMDELENEDGNDII